VGSLQRRRAHRFPAIAVPWFQTQLLLREFAPTGARLLPSEKKQKYLGNLRYCIEKLAVNQDQAISGGRSHKTILSHPPLIPISAVSL
jgi:hypothetical protein